MSDTTATESQTPEAPADLREPQATRFTAMRRAITQTVVTSAAYPTFTVTASADVTDLLALRQEINAKGEGPKLSVNDFVVRAAAVALREHPEINASYSDENRGQMLKHDRVNVGIAVASPAGLVVPVIRNADERDLAGIATEGRRLIELAQNRGLSLDDLNHGTFTISNLGMFGVDHFTALIIPPQGAILAVGAAKGELVMRDGNVVERQRMSYTITADHRIIDGALAAQFLKTVTELLEEPQRLTA